MTDRPEVTPGQIGFFMVMGLCMGAALGWLVLNTWLGIPLLVAVAILIFGFYVEIGFIVAIGFLPLEWLWNMILRAGDALASLDPGKPVAWRLRIAFAGMFVVGFGGMAALWWFEPRGVA